MRVLPASAMLLALCVPCQSDEQDAVETDLRDRSDREYARMILDARSLGQRYRADDIASGIERHFGELLARYCSLPASHQHVCSGRRSSAAGSPRISP